MNAIYVSPSGSDKAPGTPGEPLKTLEAALALASSLARENWDGPLTVRLRGGVYPIEKPVRINLKAPVTICPSEGEQAILDGGRAIDNLSETTLNGLRCWTADIPVDRWYFNSLFVDGERRPCASLPKNGFYRIESVPGQPLNLPFNIPSDRFVMKEGDFRPTRNMSDVVAHVFHYWSDERLPLASYDPDTRLFVSSVSSHYTLHDDTKTQYAKYRLENIFEGLTEPGDWYLDRAEARLYYLPREGETIGKTRLTAPVCDQLLLIEDSADVRLENLVLRHCDWHILNIVAHGQGAAQLPGVVSLENCVRCALVDCVIEHAGFYAVDIRKACSNIAVCGCTLRDLGGGGVKINGASAQEPVCDRTHHIRVTDNMICEGGRAFLAAIGVLSMHANHVTISHNEIHDLYYTGISCGWVWGYAESSSFDNAIEHNHIYDIGHFVLSDMGGIYTLGVQPGTVIRGNLIHDIEKANYGGWAIYPDEGSSHILIENNIGYNTTSSCFHQHYGRENIVRNNIFAFGSEGVIAYTRLEDHVGFLFERNIVLTNGGQPLFTGFGMGHIESDMNVFWAADGQPLEYAPDLRNRETRVPLESLREKGYDLCSVVADPLLRDPAHGDFTLDPASPALKMGFKPIDMSQVGIRSKRAD